MSPHADRARSQRKRRILDRVTALRREPSPEPDAESLDVPDVAPEGNDTERLEARLNALEAAFEGLQDAVDRENRRHDEELAELRRQLAPGAIARSLSDDARRRGL